MKTYKELSQEELGRELALQKKRFEEYAQRDLKLNMARGKPSPEQLDLSMPMLRLLSSKDTAELVHAGRDDDLRNYGALTGLAEMQELMGALMGVPADKVVIAGNSSLSLMYDQVSRSMTQGVCGATPWAKLDLPVKFLCPVPGYDRHFAICEHFGIEMINLTLNEDGPDMDEVEQRVASDAQVKGIWCVPRFSNPTGCVYSAETVERLARLEPAAQDFRIYWDNAYAVHGFEDAFDNAQGADTGLASLKEACDRAGHPHSWYQFASTSKITFAGSGVAAMASSQKNIDDMVRSLKRQTIGSDKINQKRHLLFLPSLDAVKEHMAKQAALIQPKFDMVQRILKEGLAGTGIGSWTKPRGGYFISFNGPSGTARRIVALAREAGVVLTSAGATYPYGRDPEDANIRLAPTYPSLAELELAAEVFVVCARVAALERLLSSSEDCPV